MYTYTYSLLFVLLNVSHSVCIHSQYSTIFAIVQKLKHSFGNFFWLYWLHTLIVLFCNFFIHTHYWKFVK
ncbi:hypothetical protein X975_14242, partial [Stegodyphus mimosarum]